MHEQKIKTPQNNSQTKPLSETDKINGTIKNINIPVNKQRPSSIPKQTKPTSVKNLLQNIKKTVPLDSLADSNTITMGETLENDTDSSSQRPSVSQGVKTTSRLQGRNKIQFQNK